VWRPTTTAMTPHTVIARKRSDVAIQYFVVVILSRRGNPEGCRARGVVLCDVVLQNKAEVHFCYNFAIIILLKDLFPRVLCPYRPQGGKGVIR